MAAQGILVPLVSVRIAASQPSARNSLSDCDLHDFSAQNGTKTGQSFFLAVSTLAEICKEKKMLFSLPISGIDYIPARLAKGKVWYVVYYVKSPLTGKLKRIRAKVNRPKTGRERIKLANAMIGDINGRLAAGWNPLLEEISPRAGASLFAAVDEFLRVKTKEMRANSVRTYRSFVFTFKEWLIGHDFKESTLVASFTFEHARSFMSEIDGRDDITAITYNNYLRFFHGMFEWMCASGFCASNPFRGISRKPRRLVKGKKRRLLTETELSCLFAFLSANNPEYLVMSLLCYCCFMRPKEIALLRCSDIDLSRHLVVVRGEIAKNGKDSIRTIPDSILPAFACLDLREPELYLFGAHRRKEFCFKPGKRPTIGQRIADYWRDQVRPGCGFDDTLQFYSLKDTGITNMLSSGVPINIVQQQADHSSVAMTAIYVGKSMAASEALRDVSIAQIL